LALPTKITWGLKNTTTLQVNLLMQLVNTRLYLSSSRHAAWLLSVLHALLVPQPDGRSENGASRGASEGKVVPHSVGQVSL
jgi:hypothetical protein